MAINSTIKRILFPALFLAWASSLFISPGYAAQNSGLVVNEFMSSNTKILDEDGDSSDWIEIFNGTSSAINLQGYGLSDDPSNPYHFTFPNYTLSAGEYLVVYASGKNRSALGHPFHTNFKLSDDEYVVMTDANGHTVDSVQFGKIPRNLSFGRSALGGYTYFVDLTPGKVNGSPLAPAPQFSVLGGFYNSSVNVSLSTDLLGGQIHYTLDGRKPTAASSVYSSPITINQTTTIRAIVTKSGYNYSAPAGQTYFINFDRKGMPVLAIATEEENLWDPLVGIFPGQSGGGAGIPNNLQDGQERPIHFDYFNENGNLGFSQDGKIQIVGNSSRDEWMRPFKISGDEDVDPMHSHIEYKVLKKPIETFRHLHLRNDNQDGIKTIHYDPSLSPTFIRNDLMSDLVRPIKNFDYRDFSGMVLVVINGTNYGFMDIGEKRDNSSISENHPEVQGSDVDMVILRGNAYEEVMARDDNEIVIWDYFGQGQAEYSEVSTSAKQTGGTRGIEDFFNLIQYMKSHDLAAQSNFDYVKEHLDVESFLSSMVAQIVAGNLDVGNNNLGFWRNAPVGEIPGPFHTYSWDFDAAFGLTEINQRVNSLMFLYNNSIMLPPLLNNAEFKNAFIRKFDELLNGSFRSDNAVNIVNQLKAKMAPWTAFQFSRWGQGVFTQESWQQNVDRLVEFLVLRPTDMRMYVQQFFNLPGSSSMSFAVSPADAGKIVMKNLSEEVDLPASGTYFNGVPMTIEVINRRGYRFDHFQIGSNVVMSAEYSFTPNQNTAVTAYFVRDDNAPVGDLAINEVVTGGNKKFLDEDAELQDWIEIYNTTTHPIDLTGKFLSDDPANLIKWSFPNITLGPKQFKIIYASGKDRSNATGNLHTDFKISTGESVILTDSNGVDILDEIDGAQMASVQSNNSGGRYPDGSNKFRSMSVATPGQSNQFAEPPTPATITTPVANATLSSDHVTFSWSGGSTQAQAYQLNIGRTLSIFQTRVANDFISSQLVTGSSVNITNIPQDGNNIYVRLWTNVSGTWVAAPVITYHTDVAPATVSFAQDVSAPTAQARSASLQTVSSTQTPEATPQPLAETQPISAEIQTAVLEPITVAESKNTPVAKDAIAAKETNAVTNESKKYTLAQITPDRKGNVIRKDLSIQWSRGKGANGYYLDVASSKERLVIRGGGDIYSKLFWVGETSTTLKTIPTKGHVYVRLWTRVNTTEWKAGPVIDTGLVR